MRPGDFNCKLRLFRSHDHVGRLVQQQLIGRRRIAALRKLGIDRGNVHHGTVRRYFLVTETAITARTYDIIACEGVDVAIGEPGRAIIERTLVRKLIDPLRRPGSPIVDIGPTRRIHIVGGTVGEVVGECIFIPPAGLAELAFYGYLQTSCLSFRKTLEGETN